MIEKLKDKICLRDEIIEEIGSKLNEVIEVLNQIQKTHIGAELKDMEQKKSYDEQKESQ